MKTILIVEDDRDIREGLTDFLVEVGFGVTSAQNGSVGLGMLESLATLPALILLDLMMPVMDGQAFRNVQLSDSRLSTVPVVVMSASPSARDLLKDCQIDEFLKKPADLDQILVVAQRFAGGHQDCALSG